MNLFRAVGEACQSTFPLIFTFEFNKGLYFDCCCIPAADWAAHKHVFRSVFGFISCHVFFNFPSAGEFLKIQFHYSIIRQISISVSQPCDGLRAPAPPDTPHHTQIKSPSTRPHSL